jgi:hypothetical protein
MGWETRGGRRYYYQAKKVNGRVVKQYVGSGLEALDWERRDTQRAQVKAERDRLDALDQHVADFSGAVDAAVTEALTAAGYHRHGRGAWRKARRQDQRRARASEGSSTSTP